jgi:hypothetical protein
MAADELDGGAGESTDLETRCPKPASRELPGPSGNDNKTGIFCFKRRRGPRNHQPWPQRAPGRIAHLSEVVRVALSPAGISDGQPKNRHTDSQKIKI